MVDTCYWDDPYIMALDPSEKLVFLYLLTNPLTTICGVYEIMTKRIAFDTGFDREVVERILERFERDDRCLYRDGWIAMRNWIKHQSLAPGVQEGIRRQLALVPREMAEYAAWGSTPVEPTLNLTKPNREGEVEPPPLASPDQGTEGPSRASTLFCALGELFTKRNSRRLFLSPEDYGVLVGIADRYDADRVCEGFRRFLAKTKDKPVHWFLVDFEANWLPPERPRPVVRLLPPEPPSDPATPEDLAGLHIARKKEAAP
jgi:hypothetical protein